MQFPRVTKSVVDLLPSGRAVKAGLKRIGAGLLLVAATAFTAPVQASIPSEPFVSVQASIQPGPLVMQQAGTPTTMHAQHWSHSSHSSHSSHYSHSSHHSHYSSR